MLPCPAFYMGIEDPNSGPLVSYLPSPIEKILKTLVKLLQLANTRASLTEGERRLLLYDFGDSGTPFPT